MMLAIGARDMQRAKAFYKEKLGLKVTADYRQDDDYWWVSLTLPEGGVTITLTTFRENAKPGTMTLWFATSDLNAAHKALGDKGVKVNEVKDDLHDPGSGVKWFNFNDPDGSNLLIVQELQGRN
jgi:catechol 2,3-dioxygenase-like lactoylglutathione lyase family enzyme